MLFFNKKKKEKLKPKPTPYKAYVGKKEDRLEYGLYYWSQDDPLIDYLDIAFDILEKRRPADSGRRFVVRIRDEPA